MYFGQPITIKNMLFAWVVGINGGNPEYADARAISMETEAPLILPAEFILDPWRAPGVACTAHTASLPISLQKYSCLQLLQSPCAVQEQQPFLFRIRKWELLLDCHVFPHRSVRIFKNFLVHGA